MAKVIKDLELVFSDRQGKVYNFPGLSGCGMKAGRFFNLNTDHLLKLPSKAELFLLPDRHPVGFNPEKNSFETLYFDPYAKTEEPIYAVAAFIPPGYTLTHNAAYEEVTGAEMLPLFAYGPCVFYKGDFYVSAAKVDADIRHDERFLDADKVLQGVENLKKVFPNNRLLPHLANCATVNACANAKNFFLGRFEVPIPTSPVCNAQCQGCISLQPADRIPSTQTRISFVPSPEEIAELALYHFEREEHPILSFGQGCEGEPTIQAETIEKAIRLIRQKTSKGSININTNASRPEAIARLFGAGLNSIRASLNSVRDPYYSRYYQPRGYTFKEVTASIDAAKKAGGFVSLNYLSMPGFTDRKDEFEALCDFIGEHGVDMVQWRNLNYDPMQYFRDLELLGDNQPLLGMAEIIQSLQKEFPRLKMGYFNPILKK